MLLCRCCDGEGEHTSGYECYRCDAWGWVTKEEDKQPVPCAGKYVDRIQHRELTADERIQVGEAKKAKYDQWAVWFEAQMVAAMAEQFIAQRDRIIANLDPARIGKSYGKKVRGKQPVYSRKDWLQDLIDWAAAAESFGAAIEPTIHATLLQAGRDAMQDIGIDAGQFDPFTPAIIEYFHDRSAKIANDVTDETEKQLRASLSEGVIAGGSTYELRARVEAVMGNASTMRADRIARTEVSRAQGYGDLQAWTQSGAVSGKEWYTARDEMVCPFCNAMDGRVAKLNEDFFTKGDSQTVNGKTQHYNYDAVPSPPLHVNCRCTLLPVR